MCRYISAECLCELCADSLLSDTSQEQSQQPPFSAQISEVLAVVLENEDDFDGQLIALHILQDLLSKNGPAFDEQFARLGIPNKIFLLAKEKPDESESEARKDETDAGKSGEAAEAAKSPEGKPPEKEQTGAEGDKKVDPPADSSSEEKEGIMTFVIHVVLPLLQ